MQSRARGLGLAFSEAVAMAESLFLFSSFERYTSFTSVLNAAIGRAFGEEPKQMGQLWDAMSDDEKRRATLNVLLTKGRVLWIWDNVELIAGFPSGTESMWSQAEQSELADFLRKSQETRAKILLTSRRDEEAWLGALPKRITMPPMLMNERAQLARAISQKHGHPLAQAKSWLPLLQFSQGNPLTIRSMAAQAARKKYITQEQVESFVAALRDGEAAFDDETSEGRSRSLGASLVYCFEKGFTENERKQLALLHMFQGSASADLLITVLGLLNHRQLGVQTLTRTIFI